MRQNPFTKYVTIQVLVIFFVLMIFRFMTPIQTAATSAGVLFVMIPPALAWKEYKRAGFKEWAFFLGLLQFWLLFALPIMGLRLAYWDQDFNNLDLFGIPAPELHHWSSKSYILMMLLTVLPWWRYSTKEKAGS